jgi:hypothetical protein
MIVSRGLCESGRVRTRILDTPQDRGELSDHVPLCAEIEVGEEAGGHSGLVEKKSTNESEE